MSTTVGFLPLRTAVTSIGLRKKQVANFCSTRMSTTSDLRSTEEHFDVLNEDGSPKRFAKARSLVHRDGDWHRSTHIWLFSSQGEVLVQLRAAGKDTFPGRWDVSVGGHITAGDSSLPSATRELEEELGLKLEDSEKLHLLTTVTASAIGSTKKHGPYTDNEIQDVYVYKPKTTVPTDAMVLQSDEVDRVEYWPWEEYREKCMADDPMLVPRSAMYKQIAFPLLDKVASGSTWSP